MSVPSATVLLAHGNDEMRAFLGEQMARQYEIHLASDREQLLQRVRESTPDLLVADCGLSDGSPGSLCRNVREEIPGRWIPLILLATSLGPAETNADAAPPHPARPDEIIEKPFEVGTLKECVDRLVPGAYPAARRQGGFGPIVGTAIEVIEAHLDDPDLTVGTLADAVGVSRRHLARRMKDELGTTPSALLRSRRIERAKRHLEETPDTIAGVANAVGFRSPSHFSQVFRKVVGCTPTTYSRDLS